MIFELLWTLIGALCICGYLFLWISQVLERRYHTVLSKYSNSTPPEQEESSDFPRPPVTVFSSLTKIDQYISEIEPESTNLDNKDNIDDNLEASDILDITNLDEMDDDKMSDILDKQKLRYRRSFDASMVDEESDFLSGSDKLDILKLKKSDRNTQYYAVCTIKCETNSDFIQATEGSSIKIEDFDNLDFWISYIDSDNAKIAIVPKCCLTTSPGGNINSQDQSRKRNPRETFREDILQISNKNQEASMKRKYALADMIECDREYCATLKLIKDILSSLDTGSNEFDEVLESLFSDVLSKVSGLSEFHENELLTKLSACVMNPMDVPKLLLERKLKFNLYSKLLHQWSILKDGLGNSNKKYIFLKNSKTEEKSKFSIISFYDLMEKVQKKINQYNLFLLDIMRYTGRLDGNVFDFQKSVNMFNRIRRRTEEDLFLKSLLDGIDIDFSKERLIRMTEPVTVSETELMNTDYKNLKVHNETICSMSLLKHHLVCVNNNIELTKIHILDLHNTRIYSKDNYESLNDLIIWSKMNSQNYRIFIFHFSKRINKLGWLHDIKKRLKKEGVAEIFVSSVENESHYRQYFEKYQRLATIEMESVNLESATLDEDGSSNYDLMEDAISAAETISDVKFQSATMEIPSSVTTGSYKTAAEALKTLTDKPSRPVSGISQDSISTLDGVRTPFSDEESLRVVSIMSDIDEINVQEGNQLTWITTLMNYDSAQHEIVWLLSGKIIDLKNSGISVRITEILNKMYECRFIKEYISKLESGLLTCKIIDNISGILLAAKSVDVLVPSINSALELMSETKEVTVVENQIITLKLNVTNDSVRKSILNYLIWYKDNEKLDMTDQRISCFVDEKQNQIVLNIERASIYDSGIYTIGQVKSGQISNKTEKNISILLLVEKCKKTIYQAASQESQVFLGDSHIRSISPLKESVNITKYDDTDGTQHLYDNALSSSTQINESLHPVISVENNFIEVLENSKVNLKVAMHTKLTGDPKWHLNKCQINPSKNVKIIYLRDKNIAELIIDKCEKKFEGIYKCSVIDQSTNIEHFVEIQLKIKYAIIGSFQCDIEEIDLKSGETLSLTLKTENIPISILKNGSWYLNSQKVDVKKFDGKEGVLENEVSLNIPEITKSFVGIIQYRIDEPEKLYSSEITIKVRGSLLKSDKKDSIKISEKNIVKNIGSFLSDIEEIDLKCGETLSLTLKTENIPISILKNGSWYLNSQKVDVKKFDGKEGVLENEVSLNIPEITKSFVGIIQYRIDEPEKLYSSEITIKVRGSLLKSDKKDSIKISEKNIVKNIGSFLSDIEEIDLKCGETLSLTLKTENIPISILKNGSWYLNSQKVDVKKFDGKEGVLENEVSLNIPEITKSFVGIIQYRIDEPEKLYSSEITIKVRGSLLKSDKKDSIKISEKNIVKNIGSFLSDIEEIDLKCGETLSLTLKTENIPISILKNGSWYLNSQKVDVKKFDGKEGVLENEVSLNIPEITKSFVGIIQYRIDEPEKLYSSEITIKVRGSLLKSDKKDSIKISEKNIVKNIGSFLSDIEEIDLKCGETLSLTLKTENIPISILKNGSWYLNSQKVDVKKFDGKEGVLENEVSLNIPEITKSFVGIIQYRIDEPEKLYSSEITIKVRGSLLKSDKKDSIKINENCIVIDIKNPNLTLFESETIILEYKIVSGNINSYLQPQWMFKDEKLKSLIAKESFDTVSGRLEIVNCQVSDSGQYEIVFTPKINVKFEKVVGIFSVMVKERKRSLHPIDCDIKACEGESVTLCVDVEGFVENDIKWKFSMNNPESNKPIDIDTEKMVKKFNNNLSILLIDSVSKKDEGVYICQGFIAEELISESRIVLSVIDNVIKTECHCKVNFEKEMYTTQVNENIVLRALIECNIDQYNVYWHFNGERLTMKQGLSSHTKEDGKLAELEIIKCTSEFSGIYECIIESKDGTCYAAKTKLICKKRDNVYLKYKSSILELIEGDDINIEVISDFDSDLEIKWNKNNIDISQCFDFQAIKTENGFALRKSSSSLTDSGKYKCETFIGQQQKETAEFDVIVRPSIDFSKKDSDRLKLISEVDEITVSYLKPLIISLKVLNWKNAFVKWLINGHQYGDAYELDNQFIDLYIENPSPENFQGKYICEVSNEKNELDSAEIYVKIQKEKRQSSDDNKDLLSCTVEEVDIEEHEKLELSVESNTLTESFSPLWYKNDKRIDESDPRLSLIKKTFNYNLILKDVKLNDAGTYTIKVNNITVDILVKVRTKPLKSQTKDIFKNLQVPKIKKELEDIFIKMEPETVKFEIEIEECGITKAIWFFENVEIKIENAEFIQWSCDNFFALTIPTAGLKHCGKYTIQVANDMGCVKCDARLLLLEKNEIPEEVNESCCIAPIFTKKLKDLDIFLKEKIHLNCRMMSDPKPKILWTKDGETLDSKNLNKRIKIWEEFPNFYLAITEARIEDAGRYGCLATNFMGYDITEAKVSIKGDEDKDFGDKTKQIIVKPLAAPVLSVDFSNNNEIVLLWSDVQTKDGYNVLYSIEKQKSLISSNWKKILKNLASTTCTLSFSELPPNEQHKLRCIATSEYGFESISNIIEIPIRANAPILPSDKPTIIFKDATCTKISWLRGKCKDLTADQSIGKLFYTLEMKDNPKSSWQIVSNELIHNDYFLPLEPGISYMFRVTAFNDFGISEPTQSLIVRIDRLKLVPDFSIEPPWLHLKGQPCLKWRPATVPEYCESCVSGIAPDYKVEYRNARLSPWKIYQENIVQSEVYLTPKIIEVAQEFRVSCRNKFGQNGPTRSYRLQSNVVGKPSQRSPSVETSRNIIKYDQLKNAEIESIFNDGLSLKWDSWLSGQINKYIIQKKNLYTSEWDQIQSVIFGESFFLELLLTENFSRRLRILAVDDSKNELHDGYNNILIPNRDECIPTVPINIEVTDLTNTHEIKWTPSSCHVLIDSSIFYTLQCKTSHQFWFTIADKLDKCSFINVKIDKFGMTGYRISAKNSIGASSFSQEVLTQSLLNIMSNEQIIKSIRYFVINADEVEIKWHLCESIFDMGVTSEDLTFQIETKLAKETSDWKVISDCVSGNSLFISMSYEEKNLFRIQPFYKGERLTPSRIFRMYISKDILVPDMSLIKPVIITDSVTNFIIEWSEPELQSGFSPDGIEICIPSVLLMNLKYEIQYFVVNPLSSSKTRPIDVKKSSWMILQDDIVENSFFWENPDPTQEYLFRIIAVNQFGKGLPSQIAKLQPQISLPDFSLVRLSIEESLTNASGDKETILSWSPPKIYSDLYIPYSINVQYRLTSYSSSDEDIWNILKTNIKKNRVDISELDSNQSYQLRIIPVTDFGMGKPSMITKRLRRNVDIQVISSDVSSKPQDRQNVTSEVFYCLSQNAELKFSKLSEMNIDQIKWTFNNIPINENNTKYKIFTTESYGIYLVITNLEESDFGEYCALDDRQQVLQSYVIVKSDAPTFLNCLPNRSLNLHENLFVSVQIDAQPPAEVVWRRNWKKIFSSYRTVLSEDKEKSTYSLSISKCMLSDSGEYSIRAENVVGFSEMKYTLRVDAQPEKRSIQINEGDINDRYYIMKHLSRGSYSNCQIMIEKSTQIEFVGKFFDINNMGVGKSEFECIRNINQRNIVEIFDAIIMPEQYLVLIYEKLQGWPLVDYMTNLNHWCESQVKIMIQSLIQAVAFLHSNEICHLDIKPENIIMVGKYHETVKLCGFSNAVKLEDFKSRRHMFLTSPFSAPELLKGDAIHFNCDMWSIGILAFICLHGHTRINLNQESQTTDSSDNISSFACDFIKNCLTLQTKERLSSLDAVNHQWFANKTFSLSAALDYLIDTIVKLMKYPEEMVTNFPDVIKNAIETSIISSRPKVIFNNSTSNVEEYPSPAVSQLSSRASSASRDGINYERCDQLKENLVEERKEIFPEIERNLVANAKKELLFTVPLKDQTFKGASIGSRITVTLTCQLALLGSEPISISWYKNQELLTDDSKIKLEVIKGGFLSCTILNASDNDVGIYKCVARCHSLRTETCARLILGDIPTPPEQLLVYYINEYEILLKWNPYFSSIDDIIYRVDVKVIDNKKDRQNWKTMGYSVDNGFLLENLENNEKYIARVIAQNKYGYSAYSTATSVFQVKTRNVYSLKQAIILNRKWMLDTRQSQVFNDLHDLIKDISQDDIKLNIVKEYYSSINENKKEMTILRLKNTNIAYPELIVQRLYKIDELYPAIDLCLRIKYYHLPIVYGEQIDVETGFRTIFEEHVPGGNLLSVVLARSMYSEFTVVTIIRQLLETIQFLLSNNIVHANINPSNILIARRTNQLFDIKLVGLEKCQFIGAVKDTTNNTVQKMSIFQAPEFRYESITTTETDIWSLGILAFLLLTTHLPAIEDACSESDVQCCVKNTNTLLLPKTHTHFRAPKLSMLHRFSKSARKFVHNSLKKNPNERGNADYWLGQSWFKQDSQNISEMQLQTIVANPLADLLNSFS